jgi:hypothetical protein
MPQLIKPGSVKILTQDGEVQVSIALELTINLNTDGVKVSAQAVEQKTEKIESPKDSEFMIPDFEYSPKIDFGKRE